MSKTYKVQVNYKSGISMVFKCKAFKFRRTATGTTFEWESVGRVRPVLLGADDVESVWQLS